jgi:two-component system, chemotaxis family, chemotaxis protein CheY
MKILIAEDDRINSMILEKMAARYGRIDLAVNGQEAVDRFLQAHADQNPYTLVLMDIMMPEIDGLHAVRIIREKELAMQIPQTGRVKIVMTTALDDPRTVIKALYESDANAYLVKPISAKALADELRLLKLIA